MHAYGSVMNGLVTVILWGWMAVGPSTPPPDTLRHEVPADTLLPSFDSLRVQQSIELLYQRLAEEAEVLADEAVEDGLDDESDAETLSERLEELLNDYESLRDHPLNLNSQEGERLVQLGLLTSFQWEALRRYRRQYGDLLFAGELTMVEGFDERTAAVLTPIVHFGKSDWQQEQEAVTLKKAFTRAKHQLTLNWGRKLDGTEVYDDVSDSLLMAKPNAYYLGSPDKLQLKYSYRYGSKIRMGFAMEKDAGEPFLFGSLSDTLQQLVGAYRRMGFDFYGAHCFISDLPLTQEKTGRTTGPAIEGSRRWIGETSGQGLTLEALALGDYQLSFGQGLTLWSGMSFGKGSGGSSVMKRGAGVRPKAAAGEGKFFRGAAMTLRYRDFQATAFYSLRRIDATLATPPDTLDGLIGDTLDDFVDTMLEEGLEASEWASALQESGYHRTLGELAKRQTLRQQVFGGRLAYAGPQIEVGCTAYHLRLGAPLRPKPSKYNQFFFQGDHLTVAGLDFRWQRNKAAFFGELSMSGNRAFAGLAGVTVKPAGYIDFTLLYRNYGLRYQNLFLGALKESSRGQAEEGLYLGLQCSPAPRWSLLAHCDFFRLKWLTSQAYAPSWGQEYSLKVDHQISSSATMQFKFKSKTKMRNSADDHSYSYYPIFYTKRAVQFLLSYTLFGDWVLGHKASCSHYFNDDGTDSRGYLVCQDVAYKPAGKPWSLTFRYALFDSDDYQSRLSLYENDVLGAFSIPSLYGHGTRMYLLGKLKLFNTLTLYARVGCSFQAEETKTDLKAEAVWKF